MQAKFHLLREQANHLEYNRRQNPNTGMHFHSQIEVYLVLEGEIEIWINDRHAVLKPGEMSIAFSYAAHSYRALRQSEGMYLVIPTHMCGEFRALFAGKYAGDPFIRDPAAFETVRRAIETLMNGANDLITRGCVYLTLGTLYDHLSFEAVDAGTEKRDPHASAQLLIYVNDHFKGEISLSSLATAFGYNPSYLSRYFKETFGVGFNRYVTMLRLREALLLLREGNKSVTACALESGFRSLRSFYRAFCDEFGCTPRAFLAAGQPL